MQCPASLNDMCFGVLVKFFVLYPSGLRFPKISVGPEPPNAMQLQCLVSGGRIQKALTRIPWVSSFGRRSGGSRPTISVEEEWFIGRQPDQAALFICRSVDPDNRRPI